MSGTSNGALSAKAALGLGAAADSIDPLQLNYIKN